MERASTAINSPSGIRVTAPEVVTDEITRFATVRVYACTCGTQKRRRAAGLAGGAEPDRHHAGRGTQQLREQEEGRRRSVTLLQNNPDDEEEEQRAGVEVLKIEMEWSVCDLKKCFQSYLAPRNIFYIQ